MTELKECPFCGSPAEVLEGWAAFVVCCSGDEDACDTQPSTWRYSTLEAATAKWNTRPAAQAVAVDDAMAQDAARYRWVRESKQFQYWLNTTSAEAADHAVDYKLQAEMGGAE